MQETVLVLPAYDRPGDILSVSIASPEEGQVPAPGMRAVTASCRSQGGTASEQLPSLREQVRSLMPFYEDFCVLSRQEDFSARRFPLPGQVRLRPARASAGGPVALTGSIRNLYLIPDGAPAERNIQAARRIADRLA
jgi:hypothetical protein